MNSPKRGFPEPLSPDNPTGRCKRRNTTNLPDYQIQYTKYKWEFLRRNQEYINAWNNLLILEEEYGKSESPDNASDNIMDHGFSNYIQKLYNLGVNLSETTDGIVRGYTKLLVENFTTLSKEEEHFIDKKLFNQLVEAGAEALKRDNIEELNKIVFTMNNMKQAPHTKSNNDQ